MSQLYVILLRVLPLTLLLNILHYSLNFHSCLHIGHSWCTCCEFSHLTMQCMWKQCEHWPHTRGQSSPGSLQSGQQLSNGIRQIPQLSSLATHRHVATAVQPFTFTFMPVGQGQGCGEFPYRESNKFLAKILHV